MFCQKSKIYEIYLKLFHEMCYTKCSKIDKRLWLFGCQSFDEMEKVMDDDNKIIIEELRRLRMNSEFIDEYDYETVQMKLMNSNRNEGYNEGLEVGISRGINQGIVQGIGQEKITIAKNLLKEGIKLDIISNATKLSIDELKNL